jgi:hypothetical protein
MIKEQGLSVKQMIRGIVCSEQRREDRWCMSATRDQLGDILQIQIEVWRDGTLRCEAAAHFRRGER